MGNELVLNILLKANSSNASSVVGGFARNLLSLGSAAGPVGVVAGALAAVGAAAIGVGVISTKMAGDFDQAMRKNVALAGLSKDSMQQWGDAILKMAPEVGKAPKDLANGLYYVLSAGIPASQALDVVRLSARLAAEGMTDSATTANAMTVVMKSFGLGSKQAADLIVKAVADGKTTMDQFSKSIGKLGLDASMAHRSAQETTAALDVLTYTFKSTATAGTGLSQLYTQMDIKTDTLAKKAKGLGLAFDEQKFKSMDLQGQIKYLSDLTGGNTEELLKMFNGSKLAVQAFTALKNGGADYARILADMKNASKGAGAEAEAWATTQQGFNQTMARAKALLDAFMIRLGEKLLPILTQAVNAVLPLASGLMDLITGSSGASSALAPFGDVLGTIGTIIRQMDFGEFIVAWKTLSMTVGGTVTSIFYSLGKIMQGLPWGEITSGIKSLLAGGLSALTDMMYGLSEAIVNVSVWFQNTLMPVIRQAMPGFKSLASAIGTNLVPNLAALFGAGKQVIGAILGLYITFEKNLLPTVIKVAGFLAGGLGEAIRFLSPYFRQAMAAIGQFAQEIATRVEPILNNFFKALNIGIDWFMRTWNAAWPVLGPLLQMVWNQIVGIIKIAWAIISGVFKIALDILGGNWKQAWEDFKTMLVGVWDGIKTYITGTLEGILGAINGLFTSAEDKARQAKIKAEIHTTEMKIKAIQNTEEMAKRTVASLEKQKQGILRELQNTKDPAKRHMLEMKLNAINAMEQKAQAVIRAEEEQKKGVLKHLEDLKKQDEEAHKNIFQKAMDWTGRMVGGVFSAIGTFVHNVIGKIGELVVGFIGQIITLKNQVTTKASELITNFVNKIVDLKTQASQKVQDVVTAVTTFFTNLASDALQWGQNLINNFIQGIKNMAGAVAGAIGDIVKVVADHMPHSPAKRGPLRNIPLWGPTLVKMFANDIRAHTPKAISAAEAMMDKLQKAITDNKWNILNSTQVTAGMTKAQRKAYEERMQALRQEQAELTHQLELYKQIARAAGYKVGTTLSGTDILYLLSQSAAKKKKPGTGPVYAPGGGSSISTGGGTYSGSSGTTYVVYNQQTIFNISVPYNTSREWAREVTDLVDKELAKKYRRQGHDTPTSSGAAA